MVEKLTDTNLELEDKLKRVVEEVSYTLYIIIVGYTVTHYVHY